MTADARDDDAFNALPVGTRFGELEILGTLGVGGFGIVYLARDHALERDVAVKEYMPSQFASRDGRSQVSVRSVSMRETFELGRRSFVNEARLLARFDHPSLLKVYRFWEANGTAYMAMPRLTGQNLREARKTRPTPPPADWLRRVFEAVLGGLETLHAQQVWHRDVAPDNIFLPADGGPPILLDFGAARQAIGDRTQVFTAILKPSFAPIEQYAEATAVRQGPWTDFYALAAVMHELLTGRPPPPATARTISDECRPLAELALPGYPPAFLAGLDWALRVPPHQRPQTATAWREALEGRMPVPPPQAAALRAPAAARPGVAAPAAPEPLDLAFADTVQGLPSQFEGVDMPDATVVAQPQGAAAGGEAAGAAPASRGRRWGLAVAGLAGLLVAGGLALSWRDRAGAPEAAAPQRAAQPASQAVPQALSAGDAQPASAPPAVAATVPGGAPRLTPIGAPEGASAGSQAAAPRPVATAAVAVPSPSAGARTAASAPRRDTAKRIVTEKAGEFRPVPRSPVSVTPEPAAPGLAQGGGRTSAEPLPAPAEPRSATEACAGRMLLARAWCIDRQCERPLFKNDPECVRLRELRESRSNH